jgi:tetratricopeptide (TPR) repeat protein
MRVASVLSWVAVGALFLVACLQRIWDFDFWWLLETGRRVAQEGIPRTETLSVAAEGNAAVELRWLFCLALYGVVSAFGYVGATLIKTVWLAGAFALAGKASALSSSRAFLAPSVLMVAIVASNARLILRPEIVTYLLLALFLFVIVHIREGRLQPRAAWVLPALVVLWVNAHTLFILGPLVLTAWAVAETLFPNAERRLTGLAWTVSVVSWAATFVNPYGAQSLVFAWQIFGEARESVFKEVIAELQSPLKFGFGYSAVIGLAALTAQAAGIGLYALRRLDPFLTIVTAAMLVLAWSAVRNIPLFALAAIPFCLRHAPVVDRAAYRVALSGSTIVLCAFVAWAMSTDRLHLWQNESNQFGAGLAEHRFPLASLKELQSRSLPPPILNSMEFGGLLMRVGKPYYVDPRLEVYGEVTYREYFSIADNDDALHPVLDKYGFRTAFLSLNSPIVPRLLALEGWRVAWFDEAGCLLTTADVPSDAVERALEATLNRLGEPVAYRQAGAFQRVSSPQPYQRVAEFLMTLGRNDEALVLAQRALRAYPHGVGVRTTLGHALYAVGRNEEAREQFALAVHADPEDAAAWESLGALQALANEWEEARASLRRAVALEPKRANAWRWLAHAEARAGELKASSDALRRVVALTPRDATAWWDLARAEAARGLRAQALEALQTANSLAPGHKDIAIELVKLLAALGRAEEARAVIRRYEVTTGAMANDLRAAAGF